MVRKSRQKNLKSANIAVVGDVMIDAYTIGVIERLSPEAPVPIVIDRGQEAILGGAANVARNIAALGGKAFLVGVIGDDGGGKIVKQLCREYKIVDRLVIDPSRPTTTKHRIIADRKQVLRIDNEKTERVSARVERELIRHLTAINADVIIFSDYSKGVVTRELVAAAKKKFGAENVFADFKPARANYFLGVGAIFPNLKEAHELTGIHATTQGRAESVVRELAKRFRATVFLKRSEHGLSLLEKGTLKSNHWPACAGEVVDVTGAGDTVIAVAALAFAGGASLARAAELANRAAGIIVGKEKTAALSVVELFSQEPFSWTP
jgi:rfaE bifunctional protein kinase chain/domain